MSFQLKLYSQTTLSKTLQCHVSSSVQYVSKPQKVLGSERDDCWDLLQPVPENVGYELWLSLIVNIVTVYDLSQSWPWLLLKSETEQTIRLEMVIGRQNEIHPLAARPVGHGPAKTSWVLGDSLGAPHPLSPKIRWFAHEICFDLHSKMTRFTPEPPFLAILQFSHSPEWVLPPLLEGRHYQKLRMGTMPRSLGSQGDFIVGSCHPEEHASIEIL